MLRSFLVLLITAVFASAVFAQQGQSDVQSLQYEFGKSVKAPTAPALPTVTTSCSCAKPVVYAPAPRGGCCYPCYTPTPCYAPCYAPVPKVVYRRACVRPVYHSP